MLKYLQVFSWLCEILLLLADSSSCFFFPYSTFFRLHQFTIFGWMKPTQPFLQTAQLKLFAISTFDWTFQYFHLRKSPSFMCHPEGARIDLWLRKSVKKIELKFWWPYICYGQLEVYLNFEMSDWLITDDYAHEKCIGF